MRAVVLAAGRGSRMGPLTDDLPKCLLEVDGRTLLDRQLAALRAAGVTEVALVTGWRAEAFDGLPYRRFHNPDWASSSMVDSLAGAWSWLAEGPVLACYGDVVFTPRDAAAVAGSTGAIALAYDPGWLAQWSRRFADPLDDAETFRAAPDGTVAEIGGTPRSLAEIEGQYIGVVKLEPAGWRAVAETLADPVRTGGRRDMTGVLSALVSAGAPPVQAVPARGPWHEFDSATDLVAGREVLRRLDDVLFGTPGSRHTPATGSGAELPRR